MAKHAKGKGKPPKPGAPEGVAKPAAVKKTAAKKAAAKKASKRLPLPAALADAPAGPARIPKRVRAAEARHLAPLDAALATAGTPDVLDRLWRTVEDRRAAGDTHTSHSARLLARGTPKVTQKLGEEAVECVIEATLGNRDATVGESADLLYHLIVVWVDAGIRPEEVWAELARREGISGIAEKASRQAMSSRGIVRAAGTTKLP